MGGAFGFILYQIINFFFQTGGSRSKIQKDINDLKEILASEGEELVLVDSDEIALLSVRAKAQIITKGIYYTEVGNLGSVYGERLINFAYRKYSNGRSVLLLVMKDREFQFLESRNKIELKINGYHQGYINKEHQLIDVEGSSIAQLTSGGQELTELQIKGSKAAVIRDPHSELNNENTRAILELKDLGEVDQNLLLAMTSYELLLRE